MRRFVLIGLALLALAAPAAAQQSVVQKYRGQYPTPMSQAQLLALERSVASEVHGGLLRKPDGNSCGGFSCDIICFSDSELYDILGDSDGAATPTWNRTENPRGYHCERLAAPEPAPPPTPDSVTQAQLATAIAELHTTLWNEVDSQLGAVRDLGLQTASRVSLLELAAGKTPAGGTTPPSDLAADVKRIRELLELVAKRFGLQ